MTWWQWVLVAAAGAVGAPLRFVVETVVTSRLEGVFPWGTLVVNVSGSFVLGVISGFVMYHGLGTTPRVVVGTGFIGAYTTFSTWTYETVELISVGELRLAARNVAVSLVAGTLAAAAGLALAAL